ncbi:hypothetical protein PRIC1_007562 [Phytophthora ramorum]
MIASLVFSLHFFLPINGHWSTLTCCYASVSHPTLSFHLIAAHAQEVSRRRASLLVALVVDRDDKVFGLGAVRERHTPVTVLLDAQVVVVHLDAEPAVLAPIRSPRVATDPWTSNNTKSKVNSYSKRKIDQRSLRTVFGVRLLVVAPTGHRDFVVDQGEHDVLRVDPTRVGLELFRGVHTTTDGAALVDLSLHAVSTAHRTVFGDEVLGEFLDGLAHARGERLL